MSILKIYSNDITGMKQKFEDSNLQRINAEFQSIKNNFEWSMANMWTDDTVGGGLTVQQKFDSYGTNAAQLFTIANATGVMLNAIDPTYVPKASADFGYSYVINPDNSV